MLTGVEDYLAQLSALLGRLPGEPLARMIDVVKQARREDRQVFIFGNGGSAATASHMACDLGKNTVRPGRPRLRVLCLCDGMPTFSAYANDLGYESVFAEPLRSLARPGDVAIAISGSGNSPNVLEGVRCARELGLTTVGLTGFAGGKLKDLVDICLIVPSAKMELIEDVHLVVDHILTLALREEDQ